jgi:hypothetical protein
MTATVGTQVAYLTFAGLKGAVSGAGSKKLKKINL